MEGKTHYIGGSIGGMVGYLLLKDNGMLLDNIQPVIQFSIIYPFAIYGGMIPDADHHPESIPVKDPVGRVFNRVLHIFNKPYKTLDERLSFREKNKSLMYKTLKILKCSHRSWQTHSELTLIFLLYVMYRLFQLDVSDPNISILLLMTTGFTLGIISHLILDMLTTSGIYFATGFFLKTFFPRLPMIQTLRLVPPSTFFATGERYELTVRAILNVLQFFILGYVVLTMFGYTLTVV